MMKKLNPSRSRARSAAILAVWVVAAGLAACDGADDGEIDAVVADAAVEADTGAADTSAAEVSDLPSVVARLVPYDFFSSAPLEGVSICADRVMPADAPECFDTSVEGAVFSVPRNTEQEIVLSGDDLFTTIFPSPIRDRGFAFTIPMLRSEVVAAAAGAVGVTLDPERGHVITLVSKRGTNQSEEVPGTTFACDVEAEGPFYIDDNNLPSATRTGTSAAGVAAFFNLPPGEARITVAHEDRVCVLHGPGFEAEDAADVAVVPVRAGALTHANFRCPE